MRLAFRANVPYQRVRRYLAGSENLKAYEIEAIEKAIECPSSELTMLKSKLSLSKEILNFKH